MTTDTQHPRFADPALLAALGVPPDYGTVPMRATYPEARELKEVGENIVGRMQLLTPATAETWQAMCLAAKGGGVELLIVSGFRSFDYQADLIRSKLDAGQFIEDILKVNVAPGYSQHHTGDAVDIATPGYKPLLEEFEESPAFEWLHENAVQYGFTMSYPRDNPEGLAYEPWHWYRNSN
ncbi:MAG: D-alanyl-D-alanine carboxypeptidase family protein [Gammaproteobacteria bacterium]|jgi:D-alanyl-D-alanine carboxypeptidase|nr:D-alanyl-D-alanine carboxypeptidase family protein [Gammaproteobacteria bacterium]MDP6617659.1 D-alanyl-D-alanine carboxypeptidase family protein [Gammaproteobacteria bacterium]MDP6694377.1 D-alanyl-D-alanine carboxypeptidase family protein [Gammaproteobacteria bacterium]MDP7041652.1 D-alanyl-D-alanine carboxypeptidase family protein [Gammaproteobacteria bacterium]